MNRTAASASPRAAAEPILWPSPQLRIATRPAGWAISCDFDGTITRQDLVQAILERFAGPKWREIEVEWEAGRISSSTCLRLQTQLLRVSEAELGAFVDEAPVDAEAAGFFADCARLDLDVKIVSDGYDWVIRRVMARLGVHDVPIFANRLTFTADGRCDVSFPYAAPNCDGGTCKCRVTDQVRPRLHIGDGRSDVCVSDVAELVFAKGSLLASRQSRKLGSVAFSTFAEIRAALPDLAKGRANPIRPAASAGVAALPQSNRQSQAPR